MCPVQEIPCLPQGHKNVLVYHLLEILLCCSHLDPQST